MADSKTIWNYPTEYTKPVDLEWVARQFKVYDKRIKSYYDTRKVFNEFDGTSVDENGNKQYNITRLGNLEENLVVKDIEWILCSDTAISDFIKKDLDLSNI